MMPHVAARAALRYLLQHPWLSVLSVLGIALGVAVVASIDSANAGAKRAFALSSERVVGRATHHIVGPSSLEGEIYRMLRVDLGIRRAAPIVEGRVVRRGRSLQLLGIDPFADADFRPYTGSIADFDLGAFLSTEPAVLVPRSFGLDKGDTLHVDVGGRTEVVRVAGLLTTQDEEGSETANDLIVADIGTAQRLLRMDGRLSRVDLILDDTESAERAGGQLPRDPTAPGNRRTQIEEALPPGVRLVTSDARTATVEQMTAAFELNLNALSLLALVVAMFLIYNTMTFSVVQRRALIGRLRAIGMTRREIFSGVLLEAVVLGAIGSLLGLVLGLWMAQVLVRLVTQTINDLYYVLEVRSAVFDAAVIAKGTLLGMGATVLAAVPSAREAASSPVGVVLQRSAEEIRSGGRVYRMAAAGAAAGIAGAVILLVSGRNLAVSYLGLVLLLAAFALLTPAAIRLLARISRRLLGMPFGLIGRMSAQGIVQNLSRTAVAIAALGIAVAAAVGVGTMVESFRVTVDNWLAYTLQADLYIQPPNAGTRLGDATLERALADRLQAIPGVREVSGVRRLDVTIGGRRTTLSATNVDRALASGSVRFTDGDAGLIAQDFGPNDVLVSEPFAYRHRVGRGDTLDVPTKRGVVAFRVAGVFYDYGSESGLVMIGRERFEELFDAPGFSGISVYADEGTALARLEERIRAAVGLERRLAIRSNRGLREASMDVFDRTFAITAVLRVLALVVAFGGIVSALMALQIERAREFAVLRAEGMTPGQVRGLLGLQTGLMGAIAGLLAIPLGIVLALVLVYVINKRSFGWSLEFGVPPEVLLEAMLVALAASIVAGLYPAWKLASADPAAALRSE